MPTKSQMHLLGGREEHLGAGRGILPPSSNPFPEFTGERIGIIVIDEQSGDLKIKPDPQRMITKRLMKNLLNKGNESGNYKAPCLCGAFFISEINIFQT